MTSRLLDARRLYRVLDAYPEVETDYFEGRHQLSGGGPAYFFWEKLSG